MSKQAPGITRHDLEAYTSGTLDPTARERVKACLADPPGLERRLRQDRSVRSLLREMFAPVLREPIPERMRKLIRSARLTSFHHGEP